MNPVRLLWIVAAGEGLMGVVALVWARLAGIALAAGDWRRDLAIGIAVAGAIGAVNLRLLQTAAHRWPGTALKQICRVIVQPLFERTRLWHILVISLLAGLGEELLFRGVLQTLVANASGSPAVGLAAASVLFGAVHVGSRDFLGYGTWAACIGAVIGWLMMATGGLTAPVVAHALYDALALSYVRYRSAEICD
jgi:membrane protease YdiL (CAAX protease family)